MIDNPRKLGALYLGDGRTRFRVWAPNHQKVSVTFPGTSRTETLGPSDGGYHEATLEGTRPGERYLYRLGSSLQRPDPASRFQPEGVHGPSAIVDPSFQWTDSGWKGIPLREYVIYEIHVGTFTREGTFEAMIPHLDGLRDLGITAIELMPIAQFPGSRNWGYDGVFPGAAQNTYGGPAGLRKLVDAAHAGGLAVILDVVYNHLGPEGNYFSDFGPYFTDRYKTPWGMALNFDGPQSDEVRNSFIQSALMWIDESHIDALRLDALHAIIDSTARPFLEELADEVHALGDRLQREVLLIAESDLNDPRLCRPKELGGMGLDAQWSDDFHHSLHALLTGEKQGYYEDFGKLEDLAVVFRSGYRFVGQPSKHRGRKFGAPPTHLRPEQFVVCSQNHDQIGNRMLGDRLSAKLSLQQQKLAAAVVILSPFLPMLFMGEEYGEKAPFLYFIDHTDEELREAVRKGRQEEFKSFAWQGKIPDPAAVETFEKARLRRELAKGKEGRELLAFHRVLLAFRKEKLTSSDDSDRTETVVLEKERILMARRWIREAEYVLVFSFNEVQVSLELPKAFNVSKKWMDSAGDGVSITAAGRLTASAFAAALFQK